MSVVTLKSSGRGRPVFSMAPISPFFTALISGEDDWASFVQSDDPFGVHSLFASVTPLSLSRLGRSDEGCQRGHQGVISVTGCHKVSKPLPHAWHLRWPHRRPGVPRRRGPDPELGVGGHATKRLCVCPPRHATYLVSAAPGVRDNLSLRGAAPPSRLSAALAQMAACIPGDGRGGRGEPRRVAVYRGRR